MSTEQLLKRKRKELEELEKSARHERFSNVNERLAAWQKKLDSLKDTLHDCCVLSIFPSRLTVTSLFQVVKGTVNLQNTERVWDFETYTSNDGGCLPKRFKACKVEDLEPPGGMDDVILFTRYGIVFKIECPPAMLPLREKIEKIVSTLSSNIRYMSRVNAHIDNRSVCREACILDGDWNIIPDEEKDMEPLTDDEIKKEVSPQSDTVNWNKVNQLIDQLKHELCQESKK
jgi:hypothetical protein